MEKILTLFLLLMIICILWSLPLYVCVNLVLWLFHMPGHLGLIQAFGLCLLANVLHNMLFKTK